MIMLSVALAFIAGLVVTGGGIAGLRRTHRLARGVQGTIVDFERRFTGKSGAYFPVLSFRALDGADVRTMVPQGRLFSPPQVGKHVRVAYNPANPADAYIDSAGLRYSGVFFVILGPGLLVLAVVQALYGGQG